MILDIVIDYDIYTFASPSDLFIDTKFYIDYQGKSFPSNQWTDFTNPILNMWKYNLLEARYSNNVKFSLYFMDGPYRLDVFKDDKMQLTIEAVNSRGSNEVSEFKVQCSYYDFLKSFYEAIKKFNYMLYSKGMNKGKFEDVYNQNIKTMQELKAII